MSPEFIKILSWAAVILLSTSYWFQIYKIHIHKEVRDLSMVYHVMLALGFGILTLTAWIEDSTIFLVKQIATTVPVIVIIGQIIYHRDDHWVDDSDPNCLKCNEDLEPDWVICPYCSTTPSQEQLEILKSLRKPKKRKQKALTE
jgi:uncharacterized protein with PQ loop repeat